jgi:hypothetical protein
MRSNLSRLREVRFSSFNAFNSGRMSRLIASSTVARSFGLLMEEVPDTADRAECLRSAFEESRLDSVPLTSSTSLLLLRCDLRGEVSSSLVVILVDFEEAASMACCCCSFSMTRWVMRSLLKLLLRWCLGAFSVSCCSEIIDSVTASLSKLLLLRRPGGLISSVPSSMLSAGIDETSDAMGINRPPLLETSLWFGSSSMSTGGREETVEPSEYASVVRVSMISSRGLLPSEMRLIYEGARGWFLLVWVIWMWSFAVWFLFFREDGVTLTRTLGRERTFPSVLPASKYSMSSEVCEGNFLWRVPCGLVVFIVMGVPSSGTE